MPLWQNVPMSRPFATRSKPRTLADLSPDEVKSTVDGYTEIYDAGLERRKEHYRSFVNRYYDLVTDFYEFGWGQSFHFAPRRRKARASRRRSSDTSIFWPKGCP